MAENKYLEKIAANLDAPKKDNEYLKRTIEGVSGVALASGASQRLLGYHTVYHGTTKENADSIRKNGFNPKEGGGVKGAGHVHPSEAQSTRFKNQSQGKIHVTKNPMVAGLFAAHQREYRKEKPGFIKARVSDKMWNSFKSDPHMGGDKNNAATTHHKIDSKFVSGGKGSAGPFAFLKKQHLKNYYKTSYGPTRALKGLGMLAGGSALVAHTIKGYND